MNMLKFRNMSLVSSLPLLVIYWITIISLTWAASVDTTQASTAINITSTNNSTAEAMVFAFLDETILKSNETTKLRVKRQGGGKYIEASKMSQMKVLQLILQMIRNVWASSHVGGSHPLHHEVPKPVVKLYKDRIVSIFFPNIDNDIQEN